MNVLLIGSGGREHAMALALSSSPSVSRIWVTPGNGGMHTLPKVSPCSVSFKDSDFASLVVFAQQQQIGLVVPGPEQPLVDGIQAAFAAGTETTHS